MPRAASILAFVASLSLLACGGGPRDVASPNDVITMEEMRIVARGSGGELELESYDAGMLFERGTELLNRGRCREAIETYYDRVVAEFPTSRYVGPALYNSGLCLQEGGEAEASIPYYEAVLEQVPASRDARHASFQLAQVLLSLERWEPGLTLADRTLLREDLSAPERLEALARRAQFLLGLERIDDAERQARDALSYYRMQQRTAQIPEPYFAAAANFVLAETMRIEAEAIELPVGTAEAQHEVLDRRARLILDAQREYFNTIGHTDAQWASAAGYRIGGMYDQLWHALMRAPIPPPRVEMNQATEELYRLEYRQELARHIQPLLRHAIRYWELTLMMVERTGAETDWAARTREDLERMRGLLLQQTDPEPAEAAPPAAQGSAVLRLPARLLSDPASSAETRAMVGVRPPASTRDHGQSPMVRGPVRIFLDSPPGPA